MESVSAAVGFTVNQCTNHLKQETPFNRSCPSMHCNRSCKKPKQESSNNGDRGHCISRAKYSSRGKISRSDMSTSSGKSSTSDQSNISGKSIGNISGKSRSDISVKSSRGFNSRGTQASIMRKETCCKMKSPTEGVKDIHIPDKVTFKLATENNRKNSSIGNTNNNQLNVSNHNIPMKDMTEMLLLEGHLCSSKNPTGEGSSKNNNKCINKRSYRSKLRSRGCSIGRSMNKAKRLKNEPKMMEVKPQPVTPSFFSKPSESGILHNEEGPAIIGFPFKVPVYGASSYPVSDNLAERCKTICKICGDVLFLSLMRFHTLGKHAMHISSYKKEHGALEIMKKIFHRCFICGKLVLWDNDKIGFHMKFQHRILEREYFAKYCIKALDNEESVEVITNPQVKNISKKKMLLKKLVAKPITRKKKESLFKVISPKNEKELNKQELKKINIEQIKYRLYRTLPYRFPLEGDESSSDVSTDSSEDSFDEIESSLEDTEVWYECEVPECRQCKAAQTCRVAP